MADFPASPAAGSSSNPPEGRLAHPASRRRAARSQGVCPECGASVGVSGTEECCSRCGVVSHPVASGRVVDPTATRAALVAAADACAGGDWDLVAIGWGRQVTDPDRLERYGRLALAETGVASLMARSW